MKDNQQMTVKQREGFESMLRETLRQAQRSLQVRQGEAEEIALQKVIESSGATELVVEIRRLKSSLDDANAQLEVIGFEFRGDDLRIIYDAPAALRKSYEAAVSELVTPETEKVNSLSKALGDIWAVTTVPEAKKVIETFARS
jgi:transposase-like protein